MLIDVAVHLVAGAGRSGGDGRADRFGGECNGLRGGIGHTRQQRCLDRGRCRHRPLTGLQQRVDEQIVELGKVVDSAQKHQVSDVDGGDFGEAESLSVGEEGSAARICGG